MKNIRKAQIEDYEIIDNFIEELHDMHVKARPDMYRPAEHVYTMSEYKQILNSDDKEVLVYEKRAELLRHALLLLEYQQRIRLWLKHRFYM